MLRCTIKRASRSLDDVRFSRPVVANSAAEKHRSICPLVACKHKYSWAIGTNVGWSKNYYTINKNGLTNCSKPRNILVPAFQMVPEISGFLTSNTRARTFVSQALDTRIVLFKIVPNILIVLYVHGSLSKTEKINKLINQNKKLNHENA